METLRSRISAFLIVTADDIQGSEGTPLTSHYDVTFIERRLVILKVCCVLSALGGVSLHQDVISNFCVTLLSTATLPVSAATARLIKMTLCSMLCCTFWSQPVLVKYSVPWLYGLVARIPEFNSLALPEACGEMLLLMAIHFQVFRFFFLLFF